MDDEIKDHLAVPGPDYWSWRCLRCGHPVSAHTVLSPLIRSIVDFFRRAGSSGASRD